MKIRSIITADQQIEYNAYAAYPALWGDSYFAIEQQVDLAVANCASLILAGDVLEKSYPDSYSLSVLMRQLNRLRGFGRAFFVQGNHEFSRRRPWLSISDENLHIAHLHHRLEVLVPGMVMYGLDYQPATQLAAEMATIPQEASVLVCHQAWSELMGEHLPSDGSLVELLPDHIHLVISGDYHVHKLLKLQNRNGAAFTLLSPGSATMQSLAEDPIKYCFAMGETLEEITSLPLKNRPVEYVEMISPTKAAEDLAGLVVRAAGSRAREDLPIHLRMPIWHVRLHPGMTTFVDKLTEAAAGCAHLFIRPFGDKADVLASDDSGVSNFEEALQKELADSPLREPAVRLWRSADPKEEIAAIVREGLADVTST